MAARSRGSSPESSASLGTGHSGRVRAPPSDVGLFRLIEDASELLSALERVSSSQTSPPQAFDSFQQYLQSFLTKVTEADLAVPRSRNLINKTHLLLQRATKRLDKMEGVWGNFTSWQTVNEMEQLRATKKQLRTFSKSLQIPAAASPTSPDSSSPFVPTALSTAGEPSCRLSTESTRRIVPTPVTFSHASSVYRTASTLATVSGVSSSNTQRGTHRPPSSIALKAESALQSTSLTSQRAQNIELAQRQKLEGQSAIQRSQHAAIPERQASTQPIMHASSQESFQSTTSCMESKDQFEDPRSQAITKAAIAEIGARMATQEQAWLQAIHDPQSPQATQRDQDERGGNPLTVLPSTYNAMTPPTSVSTVMAPHPHSMADSMQDPTGSPLVGANGAAGGPFRGGMAGFMGGLSGPMPRPSMSPHYSPPKPPSRTAAERYAAPRPPPPPHPPTTVGSVTSDRSGTTCATSLGGAGTSGCVFTIVDSHRAAHTLNTPRAHSRNPSATGMFPDPASCDPLNSGCDANGLSPGVMLAQIPSNARSLVPEYSNTGGPQSAKPTGVAAAAAASRATTAQALGTSSPQGTSSFAEDDEAHPLPLLYGNNHGNTLQCGPSMRSMASMASLPSSVSSKFGQSAPRLCSSPRGVEQKYLFASPSTQGASKSEKSKNIERKANMHGPLNPVTVMSTGLPASMTMGALRDTPVDKIMESIDSTTAGHRNEDVKHARTQGIRPHSRETARRRLQEGVVARDVGAGERVRAGNDEEPSEKGSTLSVYSSPAPASMNAPQGSAASLAQSGAAARAAAAAERAEAGVGASRDLTREHDAPQRFSNSGVLSHSIGGATTSHSLALTGSLQQQSDLLKCARQSYAIPDGTMPSVAATQWRPRSDGAGIQLTDGYLGMPGCGTEVVFMPVTTSTYHPSMYGGKTPPDTGTSYGNGHSDLETSCAPDSRRGRNYNTTANSTDVEDVFRSLENAVSALTVDSTDPCDTHTHGAHASDLEPSASPQPRQKHSNRTSSRPNSKATSKPNNKSTSRPNSKAKAHEEGMLKTPEQPSAKERMHSDQASRAVRMRSSPDSQHSGPPAPSRQASTVSSGSKVAAYRLLPLSKSSQKKLPTPKQVTIVEHSPGKLAAALHGDSDPDTPCSTQEIPPDSQKLRNRSNKSSRAASQPRDNAQSPWAPPRCMLFKFLCGNCGKPPVDTK